MTVCPSSKLLPSKLTWWNLYFTFVRGTCTMNVKATEWKCIFKTYFCRLADAPGAHHIWWKPWWCVPSPCTQLWTNTTQHKEIFRISHHLTASLFRIWHRLINMEAQQHWTHSCYFQIYSKATSAGWTRHKVLRSQNYMHSLPFHFMGICVQ